MKILITGASSFVGRVLGKDLAAKGHELVGTVRDDSIEQIDGYSKVILWTIGDSSYTELLDDGIEGVIHLAFDDKGSGETSMDSTVTLACNAKMKKINQIYLTPAIANGKTGIPGLDAKFQTEEKLKKLLTVIKCGFVQGNGGAYLSLSKYMLRARIFTQHLPGNVFIPLLSQRYLGQVVEHHIQQDGSGVHYYFDSRPSFKELVLRMLRHRKSPIIKIPLPRAWNLKIKTFIERLNGTMPDVLTMLMLGTASTESYCPAFITHHVEDVVI